MSDYTRYLLIIIAFPVLFQACPLKAQNSEITAEPRVLDYYGNEYITSIQTNPELILYYNFFVSRSYFFGEYTPDKPLIGSSIFSVKKTQVDSENQELYITETDLKEIIDPKSFNPLKYQFEISEDKYTQYILGNTGKALIFYPGKKIRDDFRLYLESYGFRDSQHK